MALVRRSGCGKFPAGVRVTDAEDTAIVLEDALYEQDDATGQVLVSAWIFLERDSVVRYAERVALEALHVL